MRQATIQDRELSADVQSAIRPGKQSPEAVRWTKYMPIDVQLVDLSTDGSAFRSKTPIEMGTGISIGLAGRGPWRATVVRREGDLYGCTFDASITAEDVALGGRDSVVAFIDVDDGPPHATDSPVELPPPHVAPWARPIRVAILVLGTVAAWAVAALLIRLIA